MSSRDHCYTTSEIAAIVRGVMLALPAHAPATQFGAALAVAFQFGPDRLPLSRPVIELLLAERSEQ